MSFQIINPYLLNVKQITIILFSIFLSIKTNAQFSKIYDFGGTDFGVNLYINDTSYHIFGNSNLNWEDYLNNHKSIIILTTDLEGNNILNKNFRVDSLKLIYTNSENMIIEQGSYFIGLLSNDTLLDTGSFFRIALLSFDSVFNLEEIQFFNSDTSEFLNSTLKLNNSYYMYGQTATDFEDNYDLFLIKINKYGEEVFRKTYGGINWEVSGRMINISENELLISGSTDSGAVVRQYSTAIASNGFINKIDTNGNVIWETKIETPGRDSPIQIYDKGYISQTVEGEIVGFFEDYQKVYWGKIDVNNGNVIYSDTISSGLYNEMNIASIEKVQELQNGDVLVLSIGQNDTVYNGEYADIRRYNSNQELLWHKTYKNTNSGVAWLYSFQEDTLHNNELVFTGFNHSGIDTFSQDVWVLKLNPDGCLSASNCGLALGMIDISPSREVFDIETYPNPSNSFINIGIGNSGAHIGELIEISIYNNLGKKTSKFSQKLQGQFPVFRVDVSEYTNNIYYIKASINGKEYGRAKFVKE